MTLHLLQAAPGAELALALGRFEERFRYPLGPGRTFRIVHGDDYPRFFRAMGAAACFVAEREGRVLGVIGVAVRQLILPDGTQCLAAYLGDVKIDPHARGGLVLSRLMGAAQRWVEPQTQTAFAVVMGGTAVTPDRYTGRLGVPPLVELAKVAILRLSITGPRLDSADGWLASEAQGPDCYARLSAGRYACPVGDPQERSEMEPTWLLAPDGQACGLLEDTGRAKRLIGDDGMELRSAHLSCFAHRSPAVALRLLRIALGQASSRGFPALFVAVDAAQAEEFVRGLDGLEITVAPATVFGTGLSAGQPWNINTAEI
jgi:hypothetical protein